MLAIDFETTSGDPASAEPLSIGWAAVAAGRIRLADCGYHVVAYAGDVTAASLPIHGLLPAQLRAGVALDHAVADLRAASARRVVIAHGAWIERALLKRLGVEHGGIVDTMAIVRRLDERDGHAQRSWSLSSIARRHGVTPLRAHHAFGDAMTTAMVLIVLATEIERRRGVCTVDDLLRLGRL